VPVSRQPAQASQTPCWFGAGRGCSKQPAQYTLAAASLKVDGRTSQDIPAVICLPALNGFSNFLVPKDLHGSLPACAWGKS